MDDSVHRLRQTAYVAAGSIGCDCFITAVRRRHVRFCQRLYVEPISAPRVYPGRKTERVLLAGVVDQMHAKLAADPVFRLCVEVWR